jgi:hypothetical protein
MSEKRQCWHCRNYIVCAVRIELDVVIKHLNSWRPGLGIVNVEAFMAVAAENCDRFEPRETEA